MLLASILSVIFIISLRWYVKYILYGGTVLCSIVLLYYTLISASQFNEEIEKTPIGDTEEDIEKLQEKIMVPVILGALFIVTLIFLIYMLIVRKSVNVGCESIREASRYDKLDFLQFLD